jgi:fructose-bisphosphate aldolase class II
LLAIRGRVDIHLGIFQVYIWVPLGVIGSGGLSNPLTNFIVNRLVSIREACRGKAQMVLHGTNTFPDETTQKCIKGGMTRINVNDLVLHNYNDFVAENTGKIPLTELMGKGTDLIQELCEHQMDVMGSSGKGDVKY